MKTRLITFLTALAVPAIASAQQLLPQPKQATYGKGFCENATVVYHDNAGREHGKEFYSLHITPDTIAISFNDSTGLFYARQTLDQLRHGKRLPVCDIADWPTYEWRGCMIDVSRHFFPISFLKKQVDILSRYKINRLHLHLTDAGGWRMPIDRYPKLTSRAAWRTESDWNKWWIGGDRRYLDEGTPGAYGGHYTKDELRSLVAYAAQRGITIVPEIDMPGHSEEVTEAYPELKCEGNSGAQGDVCPSAEATYAFIHNVLDEVMDVFPSPWIHIGGDEAGKDHWKQCPRCKAKAQLLGLRSVADLQGYLIQRMAAYMKLQGRQIIGWDEVLDDSLPDHSPSLGSNVNVMVWRDHSAARRAMHRSHNVILTPGEYYLDRYQDAPPSLPYAGGSYMPLNQIWARVSPQSFTDTSASGRVLGVQGNLWTEYISTPDYAEFMLYPRMLAIADAGWDGHNRSYEQLRQAIFAQYPWLEANGVNAFDLRHEQGDRRETTTLVHHKAFGAKVTYNSPWSPYYQGKKEATLTDGLGGGWSYGDGSWQGFISSADTTSAPFDVTIDLGTVKTFSTVSLDFLQSEPAWIYYPAIVEISVSDDGSHFNTIYRQQYQPTHTSSFALRTITAKKGGKARYIRIKAMPPQRGQWLFTDEVRVK